MPFAQKKNRGNNPQAITKAAVKVARNHKNLQQQYVGP
jgi:hypothetical protein